jgi:hypothetical protein
MVVARLDLNPQYSRSADEVVAKLVHDGEPVPTALVLAPQVVCPVTPRLAPARRERDRILPEEPISLTNFGTSEGSA